MTITDITPRLLEQVARLPPDVRDVLDSCVAELQRLDDDQDTRLVVAFLVLLAKVDLLALIGEKRKVN
jgi:hypothetical protein